MIESKVVQKFGNSGHVIVPKEYVGKRLRFIAETKTFDDIKTEILEILKPYLDCIIGIYLYGSFSRNEQTVDSDIDILVISSNKLKIIDKIYGYSIISTTIKDMEKTLKKNAVLILPIIKESKPILNSSLLKKYEKYKLTKKNTKSFLESTPGIIQLNEKGIELDFDVGSLVYSLILRIRGLLIIKLMKSNKSYSKASLFDYLKNNGIIQNKIDEFYKIYSSERNGIKIKKSDIINKNDIKKLLETAENLLNEVKSLF